MKHFKFSLLVLMPFVLVFISCKKDSTEERPTEDGLVAFYEFEGNANDIIGDNTSIENYAEYVTDFSPKNNQVLLLNGFNSYINLADTFDFESKTISVWFKVIEPSNDLGVIYSSDNSNLDYGLTILSTSINDSQIELYFNFSNHIDTVEIEENTWYNATIATHGKYFSYYFNGESIDSGVLANYICSNNGNISAVLGCDRTLQQRFFNGSIDDLRIYNRQLSDDEIKVIYRAKL